MQTSRLIATDERRVDRNLRNFRPSMPIRYSFHTSGTFPNSIRLNTWRRYVQWRRSWTLQRHAIMRKQQCRQAPGKTSILVRLPNKYTQRVVGRRLQTERMSVDAPHQTIKTGCIQSHKTTSVPKRITVASFVSYIYYWQFVEYVSCSWVLEQSTEGSKANRFLHRERFSGWVGLSGSTEYITVCVVLYRIPTFVATAVHCILKCDQQCSR